MAARHNRDGRAHAAAEEALTISRRAQAKRSSAVEKPPFQVLLDEHRHDVYRFLVAAAGPNEADDCFQETFVAALRSYPRLRDASNLRSWLLTIAHNKAIDAHRARGRRAVPVETSADRAAPPSAESDPVLWEAVGELPAKQRASILHRFVNDLPYADIGRIVGCSEAAARQNVRAGLASLRGAWER
jgi:RNA polymerase sigma factor (sigma-70 family)